MTRIEFCGLPGSGKSTLLEPFISELRRIVGWPVLNREAMVDCCLRRRDDGMIKNTMKHLPGFTWKRFLGLEYAMPEFHLFASANPSLMAQIFQSLAHSDVSDQARQCVLYAVFRTILEYCLASSYMKNEILASDEGFVHRCFTVFGYLRSNVPKENILRFANDIPLPDALIHIETAPEICENRLALRTEYPLLLSDLSRENINEQLHIGCERLRTAVDQVEKRGISVFRIDNNGSLEASKRQIRLIAAAIADTWKHPRQSVSPRS